MAVDDLSEMIGKRLLVGITYLDPEDHTSECTEFVGVVTAVEPLVEIERPDHEPFTLPPETDAYELAAPGEYRLHSTGEVVVDPDYITSWTVTPPDDD